MSNNLFKPNKSNDQDKQQVPQQAPAAPSITMELLDKIAGLLKGIEAMNSKIGDNYDVIDEMRAELNNLCEQFRNIEAPEAILDESSKNFLLSMPEKISNGIDERINIKLDEFTKNMDCILKNAQDSFKTEASRDTANLISGISSAKNEISGFKEWVKQWMGWFLGSIVWAILATCGFVWKCSSASSYRQEAEFIIDSLRLNSDVYSEFINHDENVGKDFDNWFRENEIHYRQRIHRRDSLREKLHRD